MACHSLNTFGALIRHAKGSSRNILPSFSKANMIRFQRLPLPCSRESSTATVVTEKAAEMGKTALTTKPMKATAKPLPEMMEEDVIPALRTSLEALEVTQLDLSFVDNRLQGSFQKDGIPYCFWAFFPNGVLSGPKGFSLSSHGSGASTVEPFLIDEKKITPRHVVFWVEKRLAAQGILPVWKEESSQDVLP